ncbi:MAG: DUF4982 domain-containing protein [Sedimentisphaerales bacterium]|nr:DUF4982 domain-containing protein [Sedimentisphaerales bacterium]
MAIPLLLLLFVLPIAAQPVDSQSKALPRERLSLNANWRFTLGDPEDAGQRLTYDNLKPWILATGIELIGIGRVRPELPCGNPGGNVSYVQPGFDDSTWRLLNLPHDWGIEGAFNQDLPGPVGKLPWAGVGWYRKHFTLPTTDTDRQVFLDIDGAMAYSTVWLNGQFVGGWPYGYSSFRIDLTPYVKLGGENILSIRLDNPPNSSRWYPGSGLYRNVWLVKTSRIHLAHWGVFVTTPRISDDEALVNIDFELKHRSSEPATLEVTTKVYELGLDDKHNPEPVGVSSTTLVYMDPKRAREALRTNHVTVPNPKLWDVASPHRYIAVTTVVNDNQVVDEYAMPFGIRTIAVDPEHGFLLNGRRVSLQGVCNHHDLGALGAAINTRALERQLQLLKTMGCNAIRTSHNPPAPELLDLCDKLGFLVMDEAFDCWHRGKKHAPGSSLKSPNPRYVDYGRLFDDWHERDLRALIRRDRNHPCVILWSIGNELLEQFYTDGWKYAKELSGIVRQEDRTRPITYTLCGTASGFNGYQTAVDVTGYNYQPAQYQKYHAVHPMVPILASETASCVSSRGEYFFPVGDSEGKGGNGLVDFQVSSYDLCKPAWGASPDSQFRELDKAPYTLGEFVWTGFDYLGEPIPYFSDSPHMLKFSDQAVEKLKAKELKELGRILVPSRSSYFGIFDLAGFPKDRYYLYQARWRPDYPMAHILPHWNWLERDGKVTPVFVYTSGDEAELFLNGKSLGRKKRGQFEYRLRWDDVIYQPGELRVVAYREGQKWAEDIVRTTGAAAKVILKPDRVVLKANGRDISFVTVTIADSEDWLVPRSKNLVRFELTGPGEIIGVDNGDATSFEPFQAKQRKAYNGLALVIVRTKADTPGTIILRVQSDGLETSEVSLFSVASP